MKRPHLSEIFSPRGIAVVGVSGGEKKTFALEMLFSLKQAGFRGIYPVNPGYTEILGLTCYPSLRDIPAAVDHVIVCVPVKAAIPVLEDCAAKGVKSVHFFTAGFSESGNAERAKLEAAMLDIAVAGGFRIIGPNCVGLYESRSHMVAWAGMPLEPGPISLISQSGGYAEDIPYYGSMRGLRFSKVASYGNALDVDESELLDYFSEDQETQFIAAYIEGVKDGKRFISTLRNAAAKKPVVIYKGGETESGSRAIAGHTASLVSTARVLNAACRQFNVIQVDDIEQIVDVLVALRFLPQVSHKCGIAIVGRGGGPSVLASDQIEKAGLLVPQFPPKIRMKLQQFLPFDGAIFSNPVDSSLLLSGEAILATLNTVAKAPGIGMIFYHIGFHPSSRWGVGAFGSQEFVQPIIDAMDESQKANHKPVVVVLHPAEDGMGSEDYLAARAAFVEAGLPVFSSLRRAADAVAKVMDWNRRRSLR